jgi:hypothetical protein
MVADIDIGERSECRVGDRATDGWRPPTRPPRHTCTHQNHETVPSTGHADGDSQSLHYVCRRMRASERRRTPASGTVTSRANLKVPTEVRCMSHGENSAACVGPPWNTKLARRSTGYSDAAWPCWVRCRKCFQFRDAISSDAGCLGRSTVTPWQLGAANQQGAPFGVPVGAAEVWRS